MANNKKNKKEVELVEEQVVELNEELIEEELVIEELKDETIEEIIDEPVIEEPKEEIKTEVLPEILNIGAPTEIPVELIKSKRTLDSLSKDELRTYQRTGRMPE
jgi:hypothetical protein